MQLHRDRSKFDATGARLVVIGQGTPEQAAHFRDSLELEIPLYADDKRESYKAVGTKVATFGELLGPKMIAKGAAASRRDGVVQGRTVGHPAQLGGVLIVKPGNEIAYVHLSDDASDNPPNAEVLQAATDASKS